MKWNPPTFSRFSLLLLISLILLGGFLALSIVNYRVARDTIRRDLVSSALPMMRDTIYSEIQVDLVRPVFVASLMASDTFLKEWAQNGERDIGQVSRYLTEISRTYNFFSTFFVSALTNRYYHFNGLLKTVHPDDAQDSWFFSFVQRGKNVELNVDADQAANNTLTIFVNHRLHSSAGKLLGVTGVGLRLDSVADLLRGYEDKYGRRVHLVDSHGTIQVQSRPGPGLKNNIRNLPGIADVADALLSTQGVPRDVTFDREGDTVFATVRHIPELDWFLVVEQEEDRVLGGVRATLARTMLAGGGVSILVIGLVWTAVRRYQARLETLAATDALTGAYNRREFARLHTTAVQGVLRHEDQYALLMIDMDGFKQVNDASGHFEGDRILQHFAVLVRTHIRATDALIRLGGDEFAILCRAETTQAALLAERLRTAVEQSTEINPAHREARVTLSIGGVRMEAEETLDALCRRGDEMLYAAKAQGRNRVVTRREDESRQKS